MPVEASDAPRLVIAGGGGWRLQGWASSRVVAGITDRTGEPMAVLQELCKPAVTVRAEQVHGASIACIERRLEPEQVLAGCDALVTALPGVALFIRTADCLPLFFADPARGVIGLAHAGWRGLAADLPARMVAAFQHAYHSRPEDLRVAIGPAIRPCCYEVGAEFEERFSGFVRDEGGRRSCDLIGAATEQLRRAGVRPGQVLDTRHCTACERERWFSLRHEGQETGRMTSFIMVRP